MIDWALYPGRPLYDQNNFISPCSALYFSNLILKCDDILIYHWHIWNTYRPLVLNKTSVYQNIAHINQVGEDTQKIWPFDERYDEECYNATPVQYTLRTLRHYENLPLIITM